MKRIFVLVASLAAILLSTTHTYAVTVDDIKNAHIGAYTEDMGYPPISEAFDRNFIDGSWSNKGVFTGYTIDGGKRHKIIVSFFVERDSSIVINTIAIDDQVSYLSHIEPFLIDCRNSPQSNSSPNIPIYQIKCCISPRYISLE